MLLLLYYINSSTKYKQWTIATFLDGYIHGDGLTKTYKFDCSYQVQVCMPF